MRVKHLHNFLNKSACLRKGLPWYRRTFLVYMYFALHFNQVVFGGSEHLDYQPKCHFQTISCSCKEMYDIDLDLNVTVEKCSYDFKEDAKFVCSEDAVSKRCSRDYVYFSLQRQRRNSGSINLKCNNGTLMPTALSSSQKGPPKVSIDGYSRDKFKDYFAMFKCTVDSNLPANVTWLLNGSSLHVSGQMEDRHSYFDCRTSLHIESLSSKDTGNYTCLVQNEMGQAMASSYLTVKSKKDKWPNFIMEFRLEGKPGTGTGVAVVGTSLNLTCKNRNAGVDTYFFKDGSLIREDRTHINWYQMEDEKSNIKVAKLEIKNVTGNDTGNYTCEAFLHDLVKSKTFDLRIVCPLGTYQQFSEGLSCKPCDPGYYCPFVGNVSPSTRQVLCPPGYYCPRGSKSAVPCPYGNYQPNAGASLCEQCANINVSKQQVDTSQPAVYVNVTDCPPGDHPTETGKGEQQSGDITSMETLIIIGGLLLAVLIVVLALYAVRKWKFLCLYTTRQARSNRDNLESFPCEPTIADNDLDALCDQHTTGIQHSAQVVRRPPEIDNGAKYDVFICYSFKDIIWVKHLLAELEKRGFVCCVDFKDFVIGAAIVENISQAIYCSRKTVAVLTPDFVTSEWCNHELQKALSRIDSHQVVPVVLKTCTIPLVLQDRTYLDWENCHVKPHFWEMLEKALRLPSNNVICRF